MLTNLPHDTETPDIETSSPEYRKRFSGEVGSFFLERQSYSVLRLIEEVTGGNRQHAEMYTKNQAVTPTILEVGGGHAQVTRKLLGSGYSLTVQGSSEECARYIREEREWGTERLKFVSSSLWNLPFEDGAFDFVIALRLLAHVERSGEFVREICRVAKYGVIIDYPSKSGINFLTPLLFSVKKRIEGNTRPYFSYSAAEIETLFQNCDFSEVDTIKQFVVPMGIHRAIGKKQFSETAEGLCRDMGITKLLGSPAVACFKKKSQ